MKIVVEGHSIETLEIFSIEDIIYPDTVGFIIRLIDKKPLTISEKISPNEFSFKRREKSDRYRKLKDAVKAQWEDDKTELKVFKL